MCCLLQVYLNMGNFNNAAHIITMFRCHFLCNPAQSTSAWYKEYSDKYISSD